MLNGVRQRIKTVKIVKMVMINIRVRVLKIEKKVIVRVKVRVRVRVRTRVRVRVKIRDRVSLLWYVGKLHLTSTLSHQQFNLTSLSREMLDGVCQRIKTVKIVKMVMINIRVRVLKIEKKVIVRVKVRVRVRVRTRVRVRVKIRGRVSLLWYVGKLHLTSTDSFCCGFYLFLFCFGGG